MILRKATRYKMAKEGKIPAVKIAPEKNDKVIVHIPYNQELIKKIRMISGRRRIPKEKYWGIPHEEDLITKLQSLFGKNLVIDPYFYLIPLQKKLSIREYSRRTIKFYMSMRQRITERIWLRCFAPLPKFAYGRLHISPERCPQFG